MNTQKELKKGEIVVGLDIGTTKICVIVAQKIGDKKIEILGKGQVASRGVEEGEVKNIKDTSEDILKAVEIAERNSNMKIKKVIVGVAGAHVKSTIMRLSYTRPNSDNLIDEHDIKQLESQVSNIMTSPGELIISYQPQEFYVDGKIPKNNNPIGMRGNRLEANWHIIIGNTNPSKNIEMAVEMAGLELINMDLEPLASAEAVLSKEQISEGVCLIDIGGGTTDLAIFSDGMIRHTAIFPYAGEYLTEQIRKYFKLSKTTAKSLKENVNATSALYKHIPLDSKYLVVKNFKGQEPINIDQRTYCRFINACLDQIFTLVKNEIQSNFYKDALNAGIVITGGGAMINDLKNYVEQFTGIHTQIGRPNAYLSNLKDRSLTDTMYSTAIGLVLLAAKNANNDMVVTPEEIEKSKKVEVPQIEDFEEETNVVPVKKVAKKGSGWADRLKSKFDSLLLDENTVKDFEDIR